MLAKEILAAAKRREEVVEIAGKRLVVRELACAADVASMADNEDLSYKLLVRCAFDEQGEPVFTEEEIPLIKESSKVVFLPLLQAVNRVNGFDLSGDAKNSAAAPA